MKKLLPVPLSDKTVLVGQQRLSTGLHLRGLQLGDLVEDAGCDFWPWGRCSAKGTDC